MSLNKYGNADAVEDVDKLILESIVTHVLGISSDVVVNGKVEVDSDGWMDEELVVGVGFSSTTDSLARFPVWKNVDIHKVKTKQVMNNVVVIVVDEQVH